MRFPWVRLSTEERAQLDELIRKGKRSAQLLTKARILLKADVSELGEGWSDSRIAAALDTNIATIERTRRQLVEERFEAVLRRKYNPNSARPRIFDGVAEAKLIALTLSPAPEGFARWSLRLLEEKVVELHIVERASDNTIGRTLKKHSQTASQAAMGDPAGRQRGLCRQHGRRAGGLSEAARSAASARVPRRNLEAVDHRDAHADPREAGTQGASRLRIRTQWRRQSVHGVRAAGRVAACQSHRPPHRHRLRPYAQGFVGRAFSRRGEDRAGAGQSQHPQARLTLRSLPRRRGTPARRALRESRPEHFNPGLSQNCT